MCLLWPAQALASALVRFIHAVPGVGTATVNLNPGSGPENFGSIGFGQVTPFKSLRSGSFKWTLAGGGKTLATGTSTIGSGVYDIAIVAKPSGPGVELMSYPAASAKPGTSLVRVIHAAPELGRPMFMLDEHTLAGMLGYVHASPYFAVKPGAYSISAMKPWLMKPGDPTLVDVKGLTLSAGKAYTAFAIGSRGQMVRVVTVVDRGAPLTRPMHFVSMVKHSSSMGKSGSSMGKSGSSMAAAGSVMVHSGDSLWSIASRIVGPNASDEQIHAKLVEIWNMNVKRIGTGDPNLIFPGQHLALPS
jgi:nucleoid-associated protein YgaU